MAAKAFKYITTIELYTINESIIWCMNYVSINLVYIFKKAKR